MHLDIALISRNFPQLNVNVSTHLFVSNRPFSLDLERILKEKTPICERNLTEKNLMVKGNDNSVSSYLMSASCQDCTRFKSDNEPEQKSHSQVKLQSKCPFLNLSTCH